MRADLLARLGEVSHDRSVQPLWALVDRVNAKNAGMIESNLLSLSYGRIVPKEIDEVGGLRPESFETYNVIEAGDSVLRMTDLQNDQRSIRTALANERGIITSAYVTVRPRPGLVDPRFLAAALRAYDVKKVYYEMGAGVRQTLKFEELGHLPIPLPSLSMQARVAGFLDRETAEIDAMDAELNHLIQTLRERRHTAMLTHLSSTVHMPVGTLADVTLGKMLQTTRRTSDDVLRPYMRAAHVQPDGALALHVEPKEMWFSKAEAATLTLRGGDAVVVEGGGGYGRAAYVAEDISGWGFQNSIIRLRGENRIIGRYLAHALVAARNDGRIALECSTSTLPHFTAEKVGRFRVPWHAHEDLPRVVAAIDDETARVDEMIADANRLKALLAERRSTLITDVVTGKKQVAA